MAAATSLQEKEAAAFAAEKADGVAIIVAINAAVGGPHVANGSRGFWPLEPNETIVG